ncbi:MAG: hypothetical protein JWP01_1234 [Myxococcales bacterium]|nr:hypothetical protein [Myxococcales bacterium]
MAGRFLVVAALAVIGLLAGLWMLMRDTDEPVVVATAPRDAALTSTQAQTQDAAPPSPSARAVPPTQVVMRRPTPQDPTPAAGSSPQAIADDAGAKPPTFQDALKEQVLLTESQILECGDKAAKAGTKLDGEAAFGFTVVRNQGKIVIESTGVEYTNFDPATSDCLRNSANAMTFESLPDGVDAITAYRKVVFVDGALKRQWMTQMNVVSPAPPPTAP